MARKILGSIAQRVDRWIEEFDVSDLATYRVVYSIVAIVMFWGRATWTAEFPAEFWHPVPSIARAFSGPPPVAVLWLMNIALTVSLVLLAAGYRQSISAAIAVAMMILLNTFAYSFGKIDHDILIILAGAIFIFRKPWCLSLFALCIGLAMFTAGWPKLLGGWLDPNTQAVLGISKGYYHMLEWRGVAAGAALSIENRWFWEAQDWLTVALEVGFLACVVKRKAFQVACVVACLFHLGILLTLDIPFASNVIAYAAFFPLGRAMTRLHWWLPACAVLTLLICPWHGFQEYCGQFIVVSGSVLSICWLLPTRGHSPVP